jgi:hypothetical protein
MSLLTPSGGLVYHFRALRYGSGLWAPFRANLADWLATTKLGCADELLLIGPSAGHCLPLAWLARFERLTLLEPDPVARGLLALRLPQRNIETEPRDLVLAPLLSGAAALDAVLERRPRAAVLFCNMLGQLHFELTDDEHLRFQGEFARRIVPALGGHAWASFHDRWSFDLEPDPALPERLEFERKPEETTLAEAWFGADGPTVTALDHGTSQLFPDVLPHCYFAWQITPHALHVVEAVSGS